MTGSLFLVCPPGLEPVLAEEAAEIGLAELRVMPGGVAAAGGRLEAMRANLRLRGATRVLLRLAEFRAPHLAQLDRRARRIDWAGWLRPDRPIRVEAVCRKSRIYHAGAAAERVARAASEAVGAAIVKAADAAAIEIMLRIEDDLAVVSLDTSGPALHKRGHKQAVGKAPLRESLAALLLRACGYRGTEAVVDPMCGSGTVPIEAAEISAGLAAGRDRGFAFEQFVGHEASAWAALKRDAAGGIPDPTAGPVAFGSDRDAGAVKMAQANAVRAGLGQWVAFAQAPILDARPPPGVGPGLVLVNPPYGRRVGEGPRLGPLYAALGQVLRTRFEGWRVGIVTSEAGLARATGLELVPGPPIPHGGLKVRLWQAGPL
ncbi:MAG: class I SAM-dependent RNA methyltransferase [Pikeienuella sp.]